MANPANTSKSNTPKDDNQLSDELKRNNEKPASGKEEDFPGYPHYPSKEDITYASRDKQVDIDVENLPKRGSQVNVDLKEDLPAATGSSKTEPAALADMDDDVKIVPGTDADVTKEDLDLLDQDFNNPDEPLNRVKLDKIDEDDTENEELDIPGSEFDDANESIGEEDEENNYYSLGGDAHDNLEEEKE